MSMSKLGLISLSITFAMIALTASIGAAPAAAEYCLFAKEKGQYLFRSGGGPFFLCEELLEKREHMYELYFLEKWLNNGSEITSATSVDTAGETLFENTSIGAAILCSALFEGTVGPGSAYELTKMLDLSSNEIKELVGNGLKCSSVKACETGDAELWPEHLPFKSALYANSEKTQFVVAVEPNGSGLLPAFEVLCLVLGINVEELCEDAERSDNEVSNVTAGVEIIGITLPLATCGGKAETGLIEHSASDVETISLSSGTLSVG